MSGRKHKPQTISPLTSRYIRCLYWTSPSLQTRMFLSAGPLLKTEISSVQVRSQPIPHIEPQLSHRDLLHAFSARDYQTNWYIIYNIIYTIADLLLITFSTLINGECSWQHMRSDPIITSCEVRRGGGAGHVVIIWTVDIISLLSTVQPASLV